MDPTKEKPVFKRKCYGMWKIFALIVASILLYWVYLLNIDGTEKGAVLFDPMNKIVFNAPILENCCSWWPISHFILFTIIGFLFPECDLMAIMAGIGWELTEVTVYHAMGAERQGVKHPGSEKVEYSGSWMQGSFKDIFMNIAGFYVGKTIAKIYGRKCVEVLGNCDDEDKNEKA